MRGDGIKLRRNEASHSDEAQRIAANFAKLKC
jgi:hypothetical protein